MKTTNEWGFTNDPEDIERVRQWVAAAVADGWTIYPTYRTEPVESAARLSKDGFQAQVLMRDHGTEGTHRWRYEAKVSLWGPDGLCLSVPQVYDWERLTSATRMCGECGAKDVDIQRVGFAGRCCATCLSKARAKYEYDGWTR